MKSIIEQLKALEEEFTTLRRELHQQPEIGFEESGTSKIVASKLKEWGYEVHEGMAKTGVVATLKVGTGTKTIGLRADMDALPIIEESGKPWSSQVKGRFHGCGHDGHTSALLMTAKQLAKTKNFNGTVHLIFQPAEELLYGGRVMVEEGLFEKFPCDLIYGMHNMPGSKLGDFYFKEGAIMASSDTLHVEISGIGSHGAQPEKGIDATLVACHIGVALQSIVSRNVSPFEQAVITVGCIEAGQAANVVNAKALMKLSVRSLNNEVRQLLLRRIGEVAKAQAESFGATVKIVPINGCPVLENPKEGLDFAIQVAEELFGKERVHTDTIPMMGSEDFSFFLEKNPKGTYFFVGAGDDAGCPYLHNPGYDFNDDLLVPTATYWVGLTEKYLK